MMRTDRSGLKPVCALAWLALMTLGAVVCPAGAAEDERAYALALRVHAGHAWTFEQRLECDERHKVQGRPDQFTSRALQQGRATVLVAKDGLPGAVSVAFDPTCSSSRQPKGGQEERRVSEWAGKTVKVWLDERGVVQHDFQSDMPAQASRRLFMAFVNQDRFLYPAKPVRVGDEWELKAAALRQCFDLAEKDLCEGKAKLVAVREEDGATLAEVSVTLAVTERPEPGSNSTIKISGTAIIDLAGGMMVKSNNTLKLVYTGPVAEGELTINWEYAGKAVGK